MLRVRCSSSCLLRRSKASYHPAWGAIKAPRIRLDPGRRWQPSPRTALQRVHNNPARFARKHHVGNGPEVTAVSCRGYRSLPESRHAIQQKSIPRHATRRDAKPHQQTSLSNGENLERPDRVLSPGDPPDAALRYSARPGQRHHQAARSAINEIKPHPWQKRPRVGHPLNLRSCRQKSPPLATAAKGRAPIQSGG